ncbi:MAG: Arm DNA-binding domain-containing protein [Alphaproteobacteria bacterium]
MVSVRSKQGSGLLFFDFRFEGERCREQTLLADSPKNRKRLKQIADRMDAEIKLGTFDYTQYFPTSKRAAKYARREQAGKLGLVPIASSSGASSSSALPQFQEFVETWRRENEVRWRASTCATNASTIGRHLIPAFGDLKLDQIRREDVLSFRTELSKKPNRSGRGALHPKTINHTMTLLSAIFAEIEERYGLPNPCRNIKKLPVPKSDIQPFSLSEVQCILEAVRPDFRCYLTVRIFTGMRTGEAHGLKWKHIDLAQQQILIRETWSRGRTEYTKTDGSQREIQMSALVYQSLLEHHARFDAPPDKEAYVFSTATGGPLDTKNVTERIWYPLLRHLGLEARRPYHMRHTAATLWLAAGEAPEWIARQMGHSSTEMLFKTYSRYVPNLTRRDGSAMDRLLAERMSLGASEAAAPVTHTSSSIPPKTQG